jgi:hypothetical protein
MEAHIQFLGCGYNGSGYSSLISIEKQIREDEIKVFNRVLVNAGDGLQRICAENKIKLFSVSSVIITSLSPPNLAGFPGVFLALSDLVISAVLFFQCLFFLFSRALERYLCMGLLDCQVLLT